MYSVEIIELKKDVDGKVVFLSRCVEYGVITVGSLRYTKGILMWSKYIPHTFVGYRKVGGRSWDEMD